MVAGSIPAGRTYHTRPSNGAELFVAACYNEIMHSLNRSLSYFLIFTIIASFIAYRIIVRAYGDAYDDQSSYTTSVFDLSKPIK